MNITKFVLRNYRNYNHLELEFNKGLNIIVGNNAEGKTNIVEAIHFLSLARSFRTSNISDLIKKGCQFASIEARVVEDTRSKQISAIMTLSGKKIACNTKPVRRLSELSELINVLVFEPKDSLMFSDSPLVRRNFLDVNISKVSPIYLSALIRYEKLLKERNALLKNELCDRRQIDVVTDQLIEASKIIVVHRSNYIKRINEIVGEVLSRIKSDKDDVKIDYVPFVEGDDQFEQKAKSLYEKTFESDVKRKMTQIGIHREDYKMILNGEDISSHGSQGENRLAVIALKLCPYFLVKDKEKKPIIVLDDVLSELDKNHQAKLIEFLRKFEQVFITTTKLTVKEASIYSINEHTVTRRNA